MTRLNSDQIDFINAIRTVSNELADHIANELENGKSFDQVQSNLRKAVNVVTGWRIGRGV